MNADLYQNIMRFYQLIARESLVVAGYWKGHVPCVPPPNSTPLHYSDITTISRSTEQNRGNLDTRYCFRAIRSAEKNLGGDSLVINQVNQLNSTEFIYRGIIQHQITLFTHFPILLSELQYVPEDNFGVQVSKMLENHVIS